MISEVPSQLSPETKIANDFDQAVAREFSDCQTMDDFIARFGEIFPAGNNYLRDFNYKLDPKYIFEHHQISCSSAAVLIDSFARQKLTDTHASFLGSTNLTSKGHGFVMLVARQEIPADGDVMDWLINRLSQADLSNIDSYTYYEATNITPYDPTEESEGYHLFDSATEFIAYRRRVFKAALAAVTTN